MQKLKSEKAGTQSCKMNVEFSVLVCSSNLDATTTV